MNTRFMVVSLFVLLAVCTTAVLATKVEQSRISPQIGYGEPVDFCLDISGKDIPKVYAIITYPDGMEDKYVLDYADFGSKVGSIAGGYCFKELVGNEFIYKGFGPKGTGTYNATFIINDGIKELRFESNFEVREKPIIVGSVDVCKTVETVKNVDNVKSLPPSIKVHGTEYHPGDNGTIFLQLINSYMQPINNAMCWLDLYLPSKIKTINRQPMVYLQGSDGAYYYDYPIPNETGIYMPFVTCSFYYNITYSSPTKDVLVVDGSGTNYSNESFLSVGAFGVAKIYSYLHFDISNYSSQDFREAQLFLYRSSGFGNSLNVTIQRITSNWSESNVTGLNMPSVSTVDWAFTSVAPTATWVSWNVTNLVRSWINGTYPNNGFALNYTPFPNNFKSFYSREYIGDYKPRLILLGYGINQSIDSIRGSGELHVNQPIDTIVWQYENRSINQNITATVDVASIWLYADRNLTWFPQMITAEAVWNYTIRNLTWWPTFTTPSDIWAYSIRNLTYYPPTTTSQQIWEYGERNLTYYPDTTNAEAVWNYTARYIHGEII